MASTSRTRSPAYRRESGVWLIELNLRDTRQLFHTLDPAPFHEKDLDPAAETYIDEAVREIGADKAIKLLVHLPASESSDQARTLPDAVSHYFEYRADQARIELRRLLIRGLISFAIGLAFMFSCLSLRRYLVSATDFEVLREGLLIIGWVALWRPVEIFLYDWWPVLRRQQRCTAIARMPIDVNFGNPNQAPSTRQAGLPTGR